MKKLFGNKDKEKKYKQHPDLPPQSPTSTPIHARFNSQTPPDASAGDGEENWHLVSSPNPNQSQTMLQSPSAQIPSPLPSPYSPASPEAFSPTPTIVPSTVSRASEAAAPPALGILKSLEPGGRPSLQQQHAVVNRSHHGPEVLSKEPPLQKKRGFWASSKNEKDRDAIYRREDEGDLTRLIGFLAAAPYNDWSVVLEVCERASASEHNAKEAVRALRREFRYGEPSTQLSAARLWAIMLRNSSEIFIQQTTSKKFLEALEDLLTSSRTNPVVKDRVRDVVGAAAFASGSKKDSGFRGLWRRVKPPGAPDEGVPFDTDDQMFVPPTDLNRTSWDGDATALTAYEWDPSMLQIQGQNTLNVHPGMVVVSPGGHHVLPPPQLQQIYPPGYDRGLGTGGYPPNMVVQQSPLPQTERHGHRGSDKDRENRERSHRERDKDRDRERERRRRREREKDRVADKIIPLDEDMRRLFQECKIGQGNASLLSQALVTVRPEDLKKMSIVKEFYAKCRQSHELIHAQIEWAYAGAERSRRERNEKAAALQAQAQAETTNPPPVVSVKEGKLRKKNTAGSGDGHSPVSVSNVASLPSVDRTPTPTSLKGASVADDGHMGSASPSPTEEAEQSIEEQLLAALLAANADLSEALRQYEDIERVYQERVAEERSKKETRMERRLLDPESVDQNGASASRSRSPSPVGSVRGPRSRVSSERARGQSPDDDLPNHLAPPPAPPPGPRSRTPSPGLPSPELEGGMQNAQLQAQHLMNNAIGHSGRVYGSPSGSRNASFADLSGEGASPTAASSLRTGDADSSDDHESYQEHPPTAKALGKRRAVETSIDVESIASINPLLDPTNDNIYGNGTDSPTSDSENDGQFALSKGFGLQKTRQQFVYDAVAERTQQLRAQGNEHLVDGVH